MNDILDDINPEPKRNPFLKVKHVLALFIIGWMFTILGALFKIQSWPGGGELIAIGAMIKISSGILGLFKLYGMKKFKEFLNS